MIRIKRRYDKQRDYHFSVFVNGQWIADAETYEEAWREGELYLLELENRTI